MCDMKCIDGDRWPEINKHYDEVQGAEFGHSATIIDMQEVEAKKALVL